MELGRPERRLALSGADDLARAEAFELCVLEALELGDRQPPLDRWSAAYARLSELLTCSDERRRFEAPSAVAFEDEDRGTIEAVEAVSGLIYAARSYQIALHLLGAYPTEGLVVDVGAGWGPFALAAAMRGATDTCLIDTSAERLHRALKLFDAAGAPRPQTIVADVERSAPPPCGTLLAAFAWGELSGSEEHPPDRDVRRVMDWMGQLQPGGRVILVEPGTRPASRRLQVLRDALVGRARIVAPCCGATRCPLLLDRRDWCHFTRRWPIGRLGRSIADRAQRRWQEVHFSWLVIAKGEAGASAADEGLKRVLERRSLGRGKVGVRLCGADDAGWVTALERDRPTRALLDALEVGDLVRKGDPTALRELGDGVRLLRPEGLVRTGGLG
jgi:hypothetical protein